MEVIKEIAKMMRKLFLSPYNDVANVSCLNLGGKNDVAPSVPHQQ